MRDAFRNGPATGLRPPAPGVGGGTTGECVQSAVRAFKFLNEFLKFPMRSFLPDCFERSVSCGSKRPLNGIGV